MFSPLLTSLILANQTKKKLENEGFEVPPSFISRSLVLCSVLKDPLVGFVLTEQEAKKIRSQGSSTKQPGTGTGSNTLEYSGVLFSARTKSPIADAKIYWPGETDYQLVASSDNQGRFFFSLPPSNKVKKSIKVYHPAYNLYEGELSPGELRYVGLDPLAGVSEGSKLEGYVLDTKNLIPLEGATVLIKGTTSGVLTDKGGQFSLDLTHNSGINIQISYIGYKTLEVTLGANPLQFRNYLLELDPGASNDEVDLFDSPTKAPAPKTPPRKTRSRQTKKVPPKDAPSK